MWARLWATPQAHMWESMGITDEVALYVRTFCEASALEASAPARTLALRQMEGLGLSASGMARLRWKMPSTDTATTEATRKDDRRRPSAKDRLRLIQGQAAAS
jgi:hypothetical protein